MHCGQILQKYPGKGQSNPPPPFLAMPGCWGHLVLQPLPYCLNKDCYGFNDFFRSLDDDGTNLPSRSKTLKASAKSFSGFSLLLSWILIKKSIIRMVIVDNSLLMIKSSSLRFSSQPNKLRPILIFCFGIPFNIYLSHLVRM